MPDAPRDPDVPKPPPEVLRELTPTGRRRFVFAGWEETPGGYRSLIELSTEAADDPAGLARAFLEALRTSDLLGGEPGETDRLAARARHARRRLRARPRGARHAAGRLPRGGGRARAPAAQRARRAAAAADPEVAQQAIADIRARLGHHDGGGPGSAA